MEGAAGTPRPLKALALLAGAAVALLGAVTSVGWFFRIPCLIQLRPSVTAMGLSAAVCFLICALGLLTLGTDQVAARRSAGVGIVVVVLLTLSGRLTSLEWQVLEARAWHMAPNTATAFLLIGLALLTANPKRPAGGAVPGVAVLALATVALVGYLFGIEPAFGWGEMLAMAPQTAFGLAIVGIALLSLSSGADLAAGHHRLALLVGALSGAVTLLLGQALAADQQQALQRRLDADAAAVADKVSSTLELHIDALRRLAHRSERPTETRDEWLDDANTYVRDFRGYRYLAWADWTGRVRWTVPQSLEEKLLDLDFTAEANGRLAIEWARQARVVAVSGPIPLGEHDRGLLVIAPIVAESGPRGFIVAGISGVELLDSVLSGTARSSHRFTLGLAGEPLATVSPETSLAAFRVGHGWRLRGQPWNAEITPTASWVERQRSFVPVGTLCAGLISSALLALSVLRTGTARRSVVALKKEAAERRAAEEERDKFFSLSIDMLCVSNVDGYFKRLNPAFEQTLGYTIEELTTRPFLDFVHPDDAAATIAEVHRQVALGFPTMHFENRYRHKDGSYRWLAWRSTPDIETGSMYALARDVTNEKLAAERLQASEERYRGLVEAASDIIYRTDDAGRFTFVNSVGVRILGYREEELLGRHFFEIVRPDQVPRIKAHYEASLRAQNLGVPFELIVMTRDGRPIWIEQKVQGVIEEGRVVAFQAMARDVTERKAYEQERERFIQELRDALAQVRTLTSLLPMCASCRRVRDDDDLSWHPIEEYLDKKNSGTRVSHGICPECTRKLYPDFVRRKEERERGGTG